MILVFEKRERGIPALELEQSRHEEHLRDVKPHRERGERLRAFEHAGEAGIPTGERTGGLPRRERGCHGGALHETVVRRGRAARIDPYASTMATIVPAEM